MASSNSLFEFSAKTVISACNNVIKNAVAPEPDIDDDIGREVADRFHELKLQRAQEFLDICKHMNSDNVLLDKSDANFILEWLPETDK